MANLLFITISNLSTNPRIVKEILTAEKLKHNITVLSFTLSGWSEDLDNEWIKKHPGINVIKLSALKKPIYLWTKSILLNKISTIINSFIRFNLKIRAYTIDKRTILLIHKIRQLKPFNYDFVISHHAGGIYPAYFIWKTKSIPFGFDFEDFHPGERSIIDRRNHKEHITFLIKRIIPHSQYVSFASPMIEEEVIKMVGAKNIKHTLVINNSFLLEEFKNPIINHGLRKIRLVWFSQNISHSRGLETLITTLEKRKNLFSLDLIGFLDENFFQKWITQNTDFITIHKPMPQAHLNAFLSDFDIGVASEMNIADFNRQICLTNKIWAYFQSGLFILATDTPAQIKFLQSHKEHGMIFKQNVTQYKNENIISASSYQQSIEKALDYVISHIETIRNNKNNRFETAKTYAWDVESQKLEMVWNGLFHTKTKA